MTTNQPTFKVTFTPEQGTALLQLIDIAVKSAGLQVAAAAVALHDIIQAAAKEGLTPVPVTDTVK